MRNNKKAPDEALPFLEAGAYFVLQPEKPKENSRTVRYRMRLRFPDGEYVEGVWNYAKVRLERMARLSEGKLDNCRIWRLK